MPRSLLTCAAALALLAPGAAHAASATPAAPDTFLTYHRGATAATPQWILRFQMGQGLLPAGAGIAGAVLDEKLVMAVSVLRAWNRFGAAGIAGRVETNSDSLARQRFNLSSWDLLLQYEAGRSAIARRPGSLTPYAQLAAGWSFHAASASASWPGMAGGGPAGTPTRMRLDSSPSLEAALGLDVQANRALALNLQAGWRRDEPRYRMAIGGEADRAGTLRLSGVCVRGGFKFLLGRVNGDAR